MDYHFSEELNRRSVYLRLLKKLWIVPAAAALCALAGFLIYTGCVTALSSHQRYEQTSKFYIEFSVDERGNAYDYYNAATWDDLLFAHPALREVIEQGLPDGMTMEDARSYVLVDLYSDIRLMTVVVTAPTAEGAAALTDAISRSLTKFGQEQKEFDEISFLSATDPKLIVVSDRTANAVLLGAFLGFIAACLFLLLGVLLDDAVYVPEDAQKRYGLPVLGVLAGDEESLPELLKGEAKRNLERVLAGKGEGSVQLVDMSGKEVRDLTALDPKVLTDKEQQEKILVMHFGEQRGSASEHRIAQLLQSGSRILGILIADCDPRFLTRYYGKN